MHRKILILTFAAFALAGCKRKWVGKDFEAELKHGVSIKFKGASCKHSSKLEIRNDGRYPIEVLFLMGKRRTCSTSGRTKLINKTIKPGSSYEDSGKWTSIKNIRVCWNIKGKRDCQQVAVE